MRSPLPALLLTACTASVPEACASMCEAALPLQAACLEEDGLDFSNSVWGDANGFLASCETWAWEAARLDGAGAARRTCVERDASFRAEDAGCETWEHIDWEAPLDAPR